MKHVIRGSRWFEIAASVFALAVLAPFLAIALLPLGVIGAPFFLSMIVPVLAISAGNGT